MPPRRSQRSKGSLGGNPLRDDAEHTEPVSPHRDAEWIRDDPEKDAGEPDPAALPPGTTGQIAKPAGPAAPPTPDLAQVVASSLDTLPTTLAATLPERREPQSASPALAADERQALARCEQVLAVADAMFWVQGRALETIAIGHLHREDYESFEDYTAARWGRSARRAYQLIEVAPLGEYLTAEVRKIFHTATINEAHTRALLPLAKTHGNEAAALVLTTILDTDQKVTAALLQAVLAILPQDRFDREETVRLIKDYLAADTRVLPPAEPTDSTETFIAGVRRVRSVLRRTIRKETLQAAAHAHPDEARQFAAELRELANELDPGSE